MIIIVNIAMNETNTKSPTVPTAELV